MQFIFHVITSVALSGLLTTALIWLTKSLISERLKNAIKNEYDQKLETHKAELKSKTDIELEKLRSQLEIIAAQRNYKFTKLHERRAEAISEIYALLADFHFALCEYTKAFEPTGGKPRNERRDIAVNANIVFVELYRKKKIFLPKSAALKLDDFNQQLIFVYNQFFYGVDMVQMASGDFSKKWTEISEKMSDIIKPALEELEHDFRKILGDES